MIPNKAPCNPEVYRMQWLRLGIDQCTHVPGASGVPSSTRSSGPSGSRAGQPGTDWKKREEPLTWQASLRRKKSLNQHSMAWPLVLYFLFSGLPYTYRGRRYNVPGKCTDVLTSIFDRDCQAECLDCSSSSGTSNSRSTVSVSLGWGKHHHMHHRL